MKPRCIQVQIIILIQLLFCIACESGFILLDSNQAIDRSIKIRIDAEKDNYYFDFSGNIDCKPEVLHLYNEEVYPNHIWAQIPYFKTKHSFYFSVDKKYINNTDVAFECKSKSYRMHLVEIMAYNKSLKDAP